MSINYDDLSNDDNIEALTFAIQCRNYKTFEKLFNTSKDVNMVDNSQSNWTPLMHAVFEESLDMVKKLLEVGANVNSRAIKPYRDEFPLNLAAYNCCSASYFYKYIRNKKIYKYLFSLTSSKLQKIAEKNLEIRVNTIFN